MDHLPSGRATRRELFAAGFAAPAAAAAGAVWSAPQAQAATGDSGVLRGILSAELLAVFCYERVLASGTLPSNTASTARQFLGQERAHVRALSAELRRLGSALPAPPANAAQADKALDLLHGSASLSALHDERDALNLLIHVEQVLEGQYYVGISKLSASLAGRVAEIMAVEAQHDTVLNSLRVPGNLDHLVPGPFVEGRY